MENLGRQLASQSIFPAFVLLIGAAALFGADRAVHPELPAGSIDPLVFGPLLFLTYALIAGLERVLPHREDWKASHGDVRTDAAHFFFTGVATNELVRVVCYGLAFAGSAWLADRLGFRLWPSRWPLALQLALALIVAELGHYGFHRISHEVGLVWRVHAVHHSAPRLYWFNATRFHPIDLFALIAFQTLPLILLGADARALAAYALFTGGYGQLQHCNIDVRTGPLRWIFSTPELHRWHHSRDPREGNNNYGAVLSVWDLLFGTFFFPRDRQFSAAVGLDNMSRFPRRYLAQLASPFRWRSLQDARETAVTRR